MILYIISFVGYLISINFLSAYLLMSPGAVNYQLIITLISFIISTIVLSISVWVDVRHHLHTVINRLGSEVPVALKRVHPRDGSSLLEDNIVGYDADPARAVRCFVLLGEIELSSAGEGGGADVVDYDDLENEYLRRSMLDSFFTSCCSSTIEMLLYSKSKRKRRSGTSSSSSRGSAGGGASYDRYGSDSSVSTPLGRGHGRGGGVRRSLESSDDSEGDEGDEESSYDRQKQSQYRKKQAIIDYQRRHNLSNSSDDLSARPTPVA